jgi:large conductance mechanosensitive channel
MRGSAAEIGVGLVLGAGFSKFIDSLVTDILLPPIGLVLTKVNLADLYINLSGGHYSSLSEAKEAGAATINYGMFASAFVHFIIVLFAVFIVVRQMNRWKQPGQNPVESMTKKACPYCRTLIPSRAIKCPNCGSGLEDEATEPRDIKRNRGRNIKLKIK